LRAFPRKRLVGLPDEVEDLLQESLLAVHNQRHTYDAGQPLAAWVRAIAKYKLIDLLRRRSRREMLNDPLDDETEIFASADDAAAVARRDAVTLLVQLPDRQRLPIIHMTPAGAVAGLLSGAVGALIYCLHCPELAAPFIGFWYLLGILIPTAAGALFGPRLLRW
jgi:RNA polymerase sigma-70 factor (ECF subfamily)